MQFQVHRIICKMNLSPYMLIFTITAIKVFTNQKNTQTSSSDSILFTIMYNIDSIKCLIQLSNDLLVNSNVMVTDKIAFEEKYKSSR